MQESSYTLFRACGTHAETRVSRPSHATVCGDRVRTLRCACARGAQFCTVASERAKRAAHCLPNTRRNKVGSNSNRCSKTLGKHNGHALLAEARLGCRARGQPPCCALRAHACAAAQVAQQHASEAIGYPDRARHAPVRTRRRVRTLRTDPDCARVSCVFDRDFSR